MISRVFFAISMTYCAFCFSTSVSGTREEREGNEGRVWREKEGTREFNGIVPKRQKSFSEVTKGPFSVKISGGLYLKAFWIG